MYGFNIPQFCIIKIPFLKADLTLRNKKKENKALVELMMLTKKKETEYMNT